MGDLIDLNQRKYEKEMADLKENFNWTDPCSKCDTKKECKYTCSEASRWWLTLVNIMKENKNKNG